MLPHTRAASLSSLSLRSPPIRPIFPTLLILSRTTGQSPVEDTRRGLPLLVARLARRTPHAISLTLSLTTSPSKCDYLNEKVPFEDAKGIARQIDTDFDPKNLGFGHYLRPTEII
jgi:hypothetical protein